MKKFVIGMFIIGLTSLGFAQQSADSLTEVALDNITVSAVNADYLFAVWDANTPKVVQQLEQQAAAFAATHSDQLDPKSEAPFEVIFKASNGDLIALYNNDGKIQSAREKFQNVTLPMSIRKQVFATNGEWTMDRNQFFTVYREDKLVKKRYKVFLSNGAKRKKVIIDLI